MATPENVPSLPADLERRRVAATGAEFDGFLRAVARGFLDTVPTREQIEESREALRTRRLTGVFDARGPHPDVPVGTVDSWVTALTTEPGRTVPLWAISGVTVAPTHRRRGIARAMLTGELQAAAGAGLALAGLTVTEATIYGRWGFGPAVLTRDLVIDTSRARWSAPAPAARTHFVEQEELPAVLADVHERTRLLRPGQVEGWPGLWRAISGLRPGAEEARRVRAVVARDASGTDRGALVYTLAEKGDAFTDHELAVRALFAVDEDAERALWRFAIEHDLVSRVTASLQPADTPVRWLVSDQRAVRESVRDHHWLRVLDVPGALSSRTLAAPLETTVRVHDPLGFAAGTWRVTTAATGAIAEATTAEPEVEMEVAALGSLLLGGVPARSLAAAGTLRADAAAIAVLDAAFAPAATPVLGIWY